MEIDNKVKRGQLLKELRKEKGLNQTELSKFMGVSVQAYQKYEYGTAEPTFDSVCKLADFYNVTTDYLLGREANPPEDALERIFSEKSFAEIEEELLRSYLQLPHDARMAVVQFLNDVAEKVAPAASRTEKVVMLSIKKSRYRTSAGIGYDLNDADAWERVNVMDCPEARKADFIVEVDGDSMQPTFYNGENVFVKATPDVEIGKIGIFVVNGKGYIKELGGGCLISHNEKYNPIPLKNTENQCIGKVLGVAELVE